MENIGFSRTGEGSNGGETAEPSTIVRDYGGGLSLLEHYLGDQNGVGVLGAAPGELPFVVAVPFQKSTAKESAVIPRNVEGSRGTYLKAFATGSLDLRSG